MKRFCVYRPVTNDFVNWHIGVVAPLSESPAANVQQGLLYAALAFLLIGALVSVFASAFAVKPFNKIKEQAELIEEERKRAMVLLDATSLACHLFDKNHKFLDC